MVDIHFRFHNNRHLYIDSEDIGILLELEDYFSFFAENYQYAPKFKAHVWDGRIRLFNHEWRRLYVGLLQHAIHFCEVNNYSYSVDEKLTQNNPINLPQLKEFVKGLNLPHKLREHQIKALYYTIKDKRHAFESSTASGKSLSIYCIIRWLLKTTNKRIMLIVPGQGLVEQMYSDFKEYSNKNQWDVAKNVTRIYSEMTEDKNSRVVISTYQSLALKKDEYFDDFDAVIIDETHQAKCTSIKDIMEKCDAPYRIGLSGTVTGGHAGNGLTIQGLLGPLMVLSKARQLIEKNELTDVKINAIALDYPETSDISNDITYHELLEYINTRPDRIHVIKSLIKAKDGNFLLLFKNIEYGRKLRDILKDSLPDREIHYIDGSTPVEKREKIRKRMDEIDNGVLIASYQTTSVGISINSLKYLVFINSSKSIIKIVQSIGRMARLHKDKSISLIYDLIDNFTQLDFKKNYVLRHYVKRKAIYEEEKHPLSVKRIKMR